LWRGGVKGVYKRKGEDLRDTQNPGSHIALSHNRPSKGDCNGGGKRYQATGLTDVKGMVGGQKS